MRFFRGWSCLLLALAGPGLIRAQDNAGTTSFGIEVAPSTRYVWRGIVLSQGPVAQPSAWVSAHDFTLTVWGNYGLNRESPPWRFNETDLTLDYDREWLGLAFEPELGAYLYPGQAGTNTAEASLKVSRPVGPVSVFSDHSVDVIATPGAYFGDAGLSFEHELVQDLCVEASVRAGWASARFNDANLGVNRAALSMAGADLALSWSPGGLLYLSPHGALSVLLDRELRAAVTSPLLITGGLAIGREF
jgi:hypothetical protein